MEVPFIPKTAITKTDDSSRVQGIATRKAASAYKSSSAASTDEVTLSPKSKLMQKLRAQYELLDGKEASDKKVEEVKIEKEYPKTIEMDPHEIVEGILTGTIFMAVEKK